MLPLQANHLSLVQLIVLLYEPHFYFRIDNTNDYGNEIANSSGNGNANDGKIGNDTDNEIANGNTNADASCYSEEIHVGNWYCCLGMKLEVESSEV